MKAARLVKHNSTQGTSILHGQLQHGVSFFLAHVVTDDTATKGGTVVRVKTMTSQFAVHHPADSVNEVLMVEILKPILIRIVGIRAMVELVSQRVFDPIFVTSVLGEC